MTKAFAACSLAALSLLGTRALTGCSSSRDERIATSSAPLTVISSVNSPVAFSETHETSMCHITGGSASGRWVGAALGLDAPFTYETGFEWFYSADGYSASSWTFQKMTSGTQFGCPGGPCPQNPPGSSSPFTGWDGDPSVAPITSPDLSNGGMRVVVVNLAQTSGGSHGVFVALSDDGGQSWGNLQWVSDATTGGSADMPFVFSNPVFPYSTYVSWTAPVGTTSKGHLRKIWYDLNGTFHADPIIDLNKQTPTEVVNRYNFGFATLPQGCSSGQEGIFYVYANGATTRCPSGNRGKTYWGFGIVDTSSQQKTQFGPTTIVSDAKYDQCVAGSPPKYTANVDPHIAVDPTSSSVWVTHTRKATANSRDRTVVEYANSQCPITTPGWETKFSAPDGCPGCTATENWLPAIAMHRYNNQPRVGVVWYGTNNFGNTEATLFMSFQENFGLFSAPVSILSSSYPVTSGTSWTAGGLDMWDYQTLGSSWQNASFLALWSDDKRPTRLMGWNGNFETATSTGWVLGGAQQIVTAADKHTGTYSLQLGGPLATNGNSVASQTFVPPLNTDKVSVWWKAQCGGGCCPDTGGVNLDWTKVTLFDQTAQQALPDPLPDTYDVSNVWHETVPVSIGSFNPPHTYVITLISHDDNYSCDAHYTFFDDMNFTRNAANAYSMMSNIARSQ